MSGQTPPSSHSGDPLQPINPYESSRTVERVIIESPVDAKERHYDARLAWSDRQALLKSVAPTRIAVVASAILWAQSLYQYLVGWGHAMIGDERVHFDVPTVVMTVLGLIFIANAGFGLYCNWLGWQYADRLQALAGGRTNSFKSWSGVHYRWEWFLAWSGGLGVAIAAGNWLAMTWAR